MGPLRATLRTTNSSVDATSPVMMVRRSPKVPINQPISPACTPAVSRP